MKTIELGQAIAVLANLGVIGGIVFLGLELRQNNQLMEAEARATSLSQRISAIQSAINPEIGRLLTMVDEGESLTVGEQLELVAFYQMFIEIWEWSYMEAQAGVLDLEQVSQTRYMFDTVPGFYDYWLSSRHTAPEGFREWIDNHVPNR